jgi:glycosyltransferase involved in cell wall biosynthesis
LRSIALSRSFTPPAPSISLLLPIRNAQAWLERVVRQALEVLPELSGRFEIRMLDEGSTDDTADVAAGLSAVYPQLRYMPPASSGIQSDARRLARHATGEIVMLRPSASRASLGELEQLWRSLATHDLVIARVAQSAGIMARWTRRLGETLGAATQPRPVAPDLCLFRRSMLNQLEIAGLTCDELVATSAEHGLLCSEIELPPSSGLQLSTSATSRTTNRVRYLHGASSSTLISRPNYLRRIARLAIGE